MRIYDKEKKCVKIVCNSCGSEIDVVDDLVKSDVITVKKTWGYFSKKDGQVHRWDMCEACYDRMVSEFLIPVTVEESTELI